MKFLDRIGDDPFLPIANQLERAERLLWRFWKKNVHIERWTNRTHSNLFEAQLEEHGDIMLEAAIDPLTGSSAVAYPEFFANCKDRLIGTLMEEDWPEYKSKHVGAYRATGAGAT